MRFSTAFCVCKKHPVRVPFYKLSCFSDGKCIDKENSKAKEENQSCDSEEFQPRRKIFILMCHQYIVQKSEEWCCQERTDHGKAKHGGNLSSKELDDDDTDDSGNGHPDVQRFTRILFLPNQESQRFLIDTRVAIYNGDDCPKDTEESDEGNQISRPFAKDRGVHAHELRNVLG